MGDFVEGEEKLEMAVDHTYANAKELFMMFQTPVLDLDDGAKVDYDDGDIRNLLMDGELEHDIEVLGEEEQEMLRATEKNGEDEGEDGSTLAGVANKNEPAKPPWSLRTNPVTAWAVVKMRQLRSPTTRMTPSRTQRTLPERAMVVMRQLLPIPKTAKQEQEHHCHCPNRLP